MKDNAILFGPFVGEMYWECGRFAPILPFYRKNKYRGRDITYVVLTREDRFDMYGKWATILIPLKISGDYIQFKPNCFRLNGMGESEYLSLVKKFRDKYSTRFNIIEHVFPDIKKGKYDNKFQYRNIYDYNFKPRNKNYDLVNNFLPVNDKHIVIISSRFREGFQRNWPNWQTFFDILYNDPIYNKFNFIICGKKGEYIPDSKNRFLDINQIVLEEGASLIGLLLVLMEKSFFTIGSQSAIPNISLLYGVEVLEFGCQGTLHTKTYNVKKTPITFIDNPKYNIDPLVLFNKFKGLLINKENKENESKKSLDGSKLSNN
jgi:hypothetical protein